MGYTTPEHDAWKAYLQEMTIRGYSGVRTIPSSLVIDTSDSCLACSRDDIVGLPSGEQGLVEYKCPCKAAKENLTPEKLLLNIETSVLF